MSDTSSKNIEKLRAVFLSYHEVVLERFGELISKTEVMDLMEITTEDLSNRENVDCDIAIAILGRKENFKSFSQDVAFLKLVKKVPVVIAMIDEGAQDVFVEKIAMAMSSSNSVEEKGRRVSDKKNKTKNDSKDKNKKEKVEGNLEDHISQLDVDTVLYLPMSAKSFEKVIKTYIATIKIEKNKQLKSMSHASKPLGEILVEATLITPSQLEKALDYQKETGLRLGDSLVKLGYIDNTQKVEFLAKQLGVPVASTKQFAEADTNIIALIPEYVAKENHCMALKKEGDVLTVAMIDVMDLMLLDNLRDITELTIEPVLTTKDIVDPSIERYYADISTQKTASTLIDDLDDVEVVHEEEETIDIEKAALEGEELGIVKLVNMIISNAIRDKASDIHIEPMSKELVVRYRVDGELRKAMSPPHHTHQAIVTRIKIISNLDIAERRLPQDGRTAVRVGNREIDIRVSILPTSFGEKVVMRILDKDAFNKSTSNLGFSKRALEIFKTQIAKPYGLIVVTGPTGSGKSTTLYSALQMVKSIKKNIITVEDPVEFNIEGITQVQVNTKIGMTFGAALRSILRQDPDIILIGEIRDAETADIAIKMSLTGHLVFSTLHTNDASSSIARFVDIGVPPLLLGSSLNLVISQRLVRRICSNCKKEYEPEAELLDELGIKKEKSIKFYKGEGCVKCNGTGYSGRIGVFELLPVTREMRTLIIRNAPTTDIQAQAEKDGMKTLRKAGIDLILKGHTTVEQVIAVTTEI